MLENREERRVCGFRISRGESFGGVQPGRVRNVMGCGGVALVGTSDVFGFFEVRIGFNFSTVLEARNVLEVFTHLEQMSIAILEA
jgi:hypothetical protein